MFRQFQLSYFHFRVEKNLVYFFQKLIPCPLPIRNHRTIFCRNRMTCHQNLTCADNGMHRASQVMTHHSKHAAFHLFLPLCLRTFFCEPCNFRALLCYIPDQQTISKQSFPLENCLPPAFIRFPTIYIFLCATIPHKNLISFFQKKMVDILIILEFLSIKENIKRHLICCNQLKIRIQ